MKFSELGNLDAFVKLLCEQCIFFFTPWQSLVAFFGEGFESAQTYLGIGNDALTMYLTGTSRSGAALSSTAAGAGVIADVYTIGYYTNELSKPKK